MADELRLKVSQSDYQQKLAALDSKISELESIYHDYAQLKLDANRVLGDGDTNLTELMNAVQKNMDAVGSQHAMLMESRAMLEKQNEALGMTSSSIGELFKTTAETIGNAASVFKTLSDLT